MSTYFGKLFSRDGGTSGVSKKASSFGRNLVLNSIASSRLDFPPEDSETLGSPLGGRVRRRRSCQTFFFLEVELECFRNFFFHNLEFEKTFSLWTEKSSSYTKYFLKLKELKRR